MRRLTQVAVNSQSLGLKMRCTFLFCMSSYFIAQLQRERERERKPNSKTHIMPNHTFHYANLPKCDAIYYPSADVQWHATFIYLLDMHFLVDCNLSN